MRWHWLVCTLITVLFHSLVAADSLVIAGQPQPLPAPLIVDKQEVLAPLTAGLHLLGASCAVRGKTIILLAADGTRITLSLGRSFAQVGAKRLPLPAAPRLIIGVLYLPATSLAPLLGAEEQFSARDRALTLRPFLQVSSQTRQQQVAVLVRCAAPLHYTRQTLASPTRLCFDFDNVAFPLKAQTIPVAAAGLARIRVAHAQRAGKIRLALDVNGTPTADTRLSEQNHLLTILLGTKASTAAKPAKSASMTLTAATLQACSAAQSALTLYTDAPVAGMSASYQRKKHLLTLTFAKGCSGLSANALDALHDSVITRVAMSGKANTPATLTISLQHDVPYQVETGDREVLVTVGAGCLRGVVVVIDPGHGGVRDDDEGSKGDPGATGVHGTLEKDIALDVGLRAAHLLRRQGATVYLTRTTDVFIELQERAALANAKQADLFVAIHCNSTPDDPSVTGIETIYHSPASRPLALALQAALVKGEGLVDREAKEDTRGLCVLHACHMPAALVELGFLSNAHEEALLATAAFRQQAALALVNGIRLYATAKR